VIPDWSAHHVLIVACGPSAARVDLEPFRSSKVIAVNEAWRLCPWADVLYAGDAEFWQAGRSDGFRGLRVSAADWPGVERVSVEGDDLVLDRPGVVGAGGTSAFQALNLAVQWGARRIGLVGVDCRLDDGEHWHARTPAQRGALRQSAVDRWIKAFDRAAPVLVGLGVEVVNHSGASALTGFRKEPLPEVLDAMWLRFDEDFDFTPEADRRVTIAYKASPTPRNVTRECARKAVEAGKGRIVKAPRKGEA